MINLLWICVFSAQVQAFGPPSVDANNDGVKEFKEENYNQAFQNFAKALGKDPFNSDYHFNLGNTFFQQGEYGKAMAEYEAAEAQTKASPERKFEAMFNSGNAAVEMKDFAKALGYYQRALEHNPDSVETKTNIELALKNQQGGGGQNKDKKDQKDQSQSDDDKQQEGQQPKKEDQPKKYEEPKKQPRQFKSQALNEDEVRRILEELKGQEEKIRAKQLQDNKKSKDKPNEKDW